MRLEGRFWLAERVEQAGDDARERLIANPARYRFSLRYPDQRLRSDLQRFRADIEGDDDEIEEWEFLDGRRSSSSKSS